MLEAIVIGCGTIGAAVGAALASKGVVTGLYDIAPLRREALRNRSLLFVEIELAQALLAAVAARKLRVLDSLERQPAPTNYIVCTPTPVGAAGEFDASAIMSALETILGVAQTGDAIFIRSTVPIGVTRKLASRLRARGFELQFASTPDRSIEGRNFADQFSVPHLIGGVDAQSAIRAAALFGHLGRTIDVGAPEASEAAKLFSNVWRATMFATSNAMALVCESHGLDVRAIFEAVTTDYDRFSPARPGPVGGPCLSKDIRLLEAGLPQDIAALFQGVRQIETRFVGQVVSAIESHLSARPKPLRIALAGLAFKGRPEVDDVRGSVALTLIQSIRARWVDARLVGWDAVMTAAQIEETGIQPAASLSEAVKGADLALFCNIHPTLAKTSLVDLANLAAAGALFYDLVGVTLPFRADLPNGARHHILGQGENRFGLGEYNTGYM